MNQYGGELEMNYHPRVESIVLVRDHLGDISILWHPAIPIVVLREWVLDLPHATVKMYNEPGLDWVEGVRGRVEMCPPIFSGISTCCQGPQEMESDLWESLRQMIVADREGTSVMSWGEYFNEAVLETTKMPQYAQKENWWEKTINPRKGHRNGRGKGGG